MAEQRNRAIEDDDPQKRRGNDERDDRFPYGGERKRTARNSSRTPVKPAGDPPPATRKPAPGARARTPTPARTKKSGRGAAR